MNRWLVVALISLICSSASALPVRNPAEPDLLSRGFFCNRNMLPLSAYFCVGYEADYVFERHLQDRTSSHRKVDHTHLTTNAAYLSLTACDRIAVFGTLGASLVEIESTSFPFFPAPGFENGNRVEIDTSTSFSWSIGLRGILYEFCKFRLGIEGEYFRMCPNVNLISINSNFSNYPSDLHLHYQEWQIGLGLTYPISNVIFPYIAAKWSGAHVDFGHVISTFTDLTPTRFITLNNLENSRNFGYAVGFSFNLRAVLLTLEWSFQDERALFLNGHFRF